ncbi:MAG: hypothetical protein ACXADD_04305 [Candidatus Thorarchaeota archaeon]
MKLLNPGQGNNLVFLVLILSLYFFPCLVYPNSDFPIGLILKYDKETIYGYGEVTHTWVETYEVLSWNDQDNGSVSIWNGYKRNQPWSYSTFEVNLSSWDYEFYDTDLNITISKWMYPLWIDISNWEVGANISIPQCSEHGQTFELEGITEIEVGNGSVTCWSAITEFVSTNDWIYRYSLYYDAQFGILVKIYSIRDPTNANNNYARHTTILKGSSILNQLMYHSPLEYPGGGWGIIDTLLVLGIVSEVIAISYLLVNKQFTQSS